ncbi:protection of telomeres protein 1b-like isoform X2 [Phaseolus vulgaris]|uniref:protection of telomeres protein 1b-like isoform X2 n=1 Tax=Phaseolus vulgaris TaxID=3885 RepID=UPI0035CC88FC
MGSVDKYTIMTLKDVFKSVDQKVNVVGVVLETGFPKPTAGTDFCSILKIIDATHHDMAMTVNIFAESTEKLPLVAAVGDVIQLCRVLVISNTDSSKFPMFREIKEETYINLACKILHCCEAANDEWFIFAWDGTDTLPNAISSNLEDELNHPLPLQLEPLPLPREILCTFPAVGSILRITLEEYVGKRQLYLLSIGKWVKFTNMRLEVRDGLWHGIFTRFTKVRYTPNEDLLIVERQRLSDERLSLKSGRMLYSSFPEPSPITAVNCHDHVTPVTLMSVLTHSEVTANFKCVVRVVAAMPCQAELLRSPAGTYRMRLTLEDSTARIHAYVIDEDGETLFDGYPGVEQLRRKLEKLLGIECDGSKDGEKDTPRNPPWICVCLKSFYVQKADIWGTRNFRIFGTKIVGDA